MTAEEFLKKVVIYEAVSHLRRAVILLGAVGEGDKALHVIAALEELKEYREPKERD